MTNTMQSRSDAFFGQLVADNGGQVNETVLRAYCAHLEEKPVFDLTGWGFLQLFARDISEELQREFNRRAVAQIVKPEGCLMCGDRTATNYHPLIGHVCQVCYERLPRA